MKAMLMIACGVFAFSRAESQPVTGRALYEWVRGIEGKDHEGRQGFVEGELRSMGVKYSLVPFMHQGERMTLDGKNIIVSMGQGRKNIVVGAHYDAVPRSPGANDNGGGVAVVLGLIRSLKGIAWNHRIDFCFFDQEEAGLIGSAEFVKVYKDSLHHLAMINLDVEGTGEEVYAGPVGGGDDDLLMPLLRKAAASTHYVFIENEFYPPSDQLSFAGRKLENISISIVPKGDAQLLVEAEKRGWKIDPESIPEVLKVMHTPQDSSSFVTPQALEKSYIFTKAVLELLNNSK